MKLDIKRINLLEKDIEDWLCDNPVEIGFTYFRVDRWIARQLRVPSGIIDLLGIDGAGDLYVVEVKNVPIGADALTQVCRYRADIERIRDEIGLYSGAMENHGIYAFVVGTAIDTQTLFEAKAVNVTPYVFTPYLNLQMGAATWNEDFEQKLSSQYIDLSENPIFAPLVNRVVEEERRLAIEFEAEQEIAKIFSVNGTDL